MFAGLDETLVTCELLEPCVRRANVIKLTSPGTFDLNNGRAIKLVQRLVQDHGLLPPVFQSHFHQQRGSRGDGGPVGDHGANEFVSIWGLLSFRLGHGEKWQEADQKSRQSQIHVHFRIHVDFFIIWLAWALLIANVVDLRGINLVLSGRAGAIGVGTERTRIVCASVVAHCESVK